MCKHVVVDLEMCRVPKGERRRAFGHSTELIQIGAVLLDDSLEICDSFQTFVQPEFGFVDDFIQDLTGISQNDVAEAPVAESALKDFLAWLPSDAIIVSWSFSDLAQIIWELEGKDIDIPGLDPYLDSWDDCQATFSQKMGVNRRYKLSEALNLTEIIYDDGAHDALVDARNTAKLFAKMEREPDLHISSCIVNDTHSCYTPFATLLAGYAIA